MRILVSNDDGIAAPGIQRLAAIAAGFGEVVVVAPAHEMSAVSHGITLARPLRLKDHGHARYSVDGTPADCIYIAFHHLLKDDPPDLVLSGVNHGPNMGHDVHYSGTVAAAREAFLERVPAMAFSVVGDRHPIHEPVYAWIARILAAVVARPPLPSPWCLNVNLPNGADLPIRGARVTRLGDRIFAPHVEGRLDPRGQEYLWIGSDRLAPPDDPTIDSAAVHAGYVSITPLLRDPSDHAAVQSLQGWSV